MVRLSNIEKALGLECELVAKCEFFSAGGSTKVGECSVGELGMLG